VKGGVIERGTIALLRCGGPAGNGTWELHGFGAQSSERNEKNRRHANGREIKG